MRIPKREKISGKNVKALVAKKVEHMQKRYARLNAQADVQAKKKIVDAKLAT